MASTYSSNLRLELIGTGDQSGTWGATVNTNIGTLIEAAISGYVSVSVTAANQALTAVNGAADQARNASLTLTTTTGANFAVYAPPAPKLYVVNNTSAFTATIYNSTVLGNTTAAGTGVAVPAGKCVSVWSDGTNMSPQNTHLIDGATAATQAVGDSSTKVATTAFVQSAMPTGVVMEWAGTAAPTGWLLADGSAVSRATYAALFSVIGTTFGAGDGSTTFNVPNRTNRVGVGAGGLYALAATGGSKDAVVVAHSHSVNITSGTESVSHTHSVTDPGHTHTYQQAVGGATSPGGAFGVLGSTTGASTVSATTGISLGTQSASHTHAVSGTTANNGVSGTDANMQPYIGMNYIIKT